jgi:hypothetical protein
MEPHTWRLRVSATGGGQATVYSRQHQFRIGAPLDFDRASPTLSAMEYALGALGADVVNGLQLLAHQRRVGIEQLEAVIIGELNNPLTYLGVIGESGHPGVEKVSIKVYVASLAEETAIQHLWQEVLARSPLVRTFRHAVQLELILQVLT